VEPSSLLLQRRNDKLNANNLANNATNFPKPPLRRNDYGYFVSGPIKKDKLFFLVERGMEQRQPPGNLVTTCVPTAAESKGDFSADVAAAITSLNRGARPPPRTTPRAMHRLQQHSPTMEPSPIPATRQIQYSVAASRRQGTNMPSPTRTP